MQKTLYKWECMGLVRSRLVVFLDLDIDIIPSLAWEPRGSTLATWGGEWQQLLICAAARGEHLLSFPDFSSPVNAGLMLLRPNTTLYREGLRVLLRSAKRAFKHTSGWEEVGRPSAVLSSSDDAWRRRAGHMSALDKDDWGFVGADIDQAPRSPPCRTAPSTLLLPGGQRAPQEDVAYYTMYCTAV